MLRWLCQSITTNLFINYYVIIYFMKAIFKNIIVSILIFEVRMILSKHKPFIIGVTGNVGKTSTKDAIYYSLIANLDKKSVRRSEKSLNSETGVPLTIIGKASGWNNPLSWLNIIFSGLVVYFKKDYPKYLVLEIGADRKNDIKDICEYISPDISVVTAFAKYPVHIENFKDKDELIREKRYLIEATKDNGKLIYNCECPDTIKMIQDAKNEGTLSPDITLYSYGINVGDVFVKNIINNTEDKNVSCKVIINDDKNRIEEDLTLDSVFGEAAILSSLPGIIISKLLNLKIKNTIESLRVMKRAPGRMRLLDGQHNTIIIDDTYNSSPIAVENGLKTLREMKIANPYINIITILGDMMELGDMSKQAHNDIGKIVAKSYIDKLIVVGIRSREVKSSAIENGLAEKNIYEYTDSTEASNNVMNILSEVLNKKGVIIYIKGSQSMRMERIVRALLDTSLDASDYLARQEKEWLRR